MRVAEALPFFVSAIKRHLGEENGRPFMHCPFSLYKNFSDQLPACRATFERHGRRLWDHEWRHHLLTEHENDLRILTYLLEDIHSLDGSSKSTTGLPRYTRTRDGQPTSKPLTCPFGCGIPVYPEMWKTEIITQTLPRGRGDTTSASTSTREEVYETESDESAIAQHIIIGHTLELQALAAVLDLLVYKSDADGVCPFEVACPGCCSTDGPRGSTTARRRGLGGMRPTSDADQTLEHWWQHVRQQHLRDAMNVMASVLQQVDQEAAATQGPYLRCCLQGCCVQRNNVRGLQTHVMSHLKPRLSSSDLSIALLQEAMVARAGDPREVGWGRTRHHKQPR